MSKIRKLHDYQLEAVFGPEPSWEGIENTAINFNQLVSTALSWANAGFENRDYKQEVINYAVNKGVPTVRLETLADWKFINAGKVAWLLNNGCPLTENWIRRFKQNFETLLTDAGTDEDLPIEVKETVSLAERKQIFRTKQVKEHLLDIEELIDAALVNNSSIDSSAIYHKYMGKKIDEKIAKEVFAQLKDKSEILFNELNSLEKLKDDEIIKQFNDKNIYENYAEDIRNNANQIAEAANQIGSYLGNKKAIKKSEKKFGSKIAARRAETQVSNVNFKVQDSEWKVSSINPMSIIGSKTLITFNTESKKIGIYIAADETGLNIKGTTIQNYDEGKSFQKIIKKPVKLGHIRDANIKRLKDILNIIKAKTSPVNGRINDKIILLKTFDLIYDA